MAMATDHERRYHSGWLWSLVLVCIATLPFLVHGWFEANDETNDAAIYVACARSILAGDGYSYLGVPFTIRPPATSYLTAAVMAWRGESWPLDGWWWMNLVTSCIGIAGIVWMYLHARTRVPVWLAWLLALAVWFSTPYQELCNQVMSDVPGAALVLLCLGLERWAQAHASTTQRAWWTGAVVGVAIGLSTYMRSIAILLVPAIVAARSFAHWRTGQKNWTAFVVRRLVPLVAAAWLVKLPWDLYVGANPPPIPVEQNFLHSYSAAMWHVDGGDPSSPWRSVGDIVGRVPERWTQVSSLLGSGMLTSKGTLSQQALGALVLALVAWIAWRRRAAPELFALGATTVILIYFGFRDRLLLPIWLVALPAAFEGLILLVGRISVTTAHGVAALVLLAWSASSMDPRAHWNQAQSQHEYFTRLAADAKTLLPAEARVAAPIGWHTSVFLQQPVWSLFFAVRRAGNDFSAAEGVFDRQRIDHVLLSPRIPADKPWAEWLTQRYGAPRVQGEAYVWQVRPKSSPMNGR